MTTHEPRYVREVREVPDERVREEPAVVPEERVVTEGEALPREERVVQREVSEPEFVAGARRFMPVRLLGVIAGAVLLVFGIIALVRGDLRGSINEPVVSVAGWAHTPLLGLIEIGAGVLLILGSMAPRSEMVIGALVAIAGVIALIEPKVLSDNLSISSGLAWLFIVLGGVMFLAAALATMVPARSRREVRTVRSV